MANIGKSSFKIKGLFNNPQFIFLIGEENIKKMQDEGFATIIVSPTRKRDFILKFFSKRNMKFYTTTFLEHPEYTVFNTLKSKVFLRRDTPDTLTTLHPYFEDSNIVQMFSEANPKIKLEEHYSVENTAQGIKVWKNGVIIKEKKDDYI
jgi:hypothetical protein